MFVSTAYAMGTAGTGGSAGDAFMQFVPLLLMLAIFYFLLIRPQQKRAKQHRAMLDGLKKGDHIITTGGIMGRIVDINGEILSIDLGESKANVLRSYVAGLVDAKGQEKETK